MLDASIESTSFLHAVLRCSVHVCCLGLGSLTRGSRALVNHSAWSIPQAALEGLVQDGSKRKPTVATDEEASQSKRQHVQVGLSHIKASFKD